MSASLSVSANLLETRSSRLFPQGLGLGLSPELLEEFSLRPLDLNEYLSASNPWTARLLDCVPFRQERTLELVEREYNQDFYGRMLEKYRHRPEDLRRDVLNGSNLILDFCLRDEIFSGPLSSFNFIKRTYVQTLVGHYAGQAPLCELGAGYGTNFFWMNRPIYGGEFCDNALQLASILGFEVHKFNFYEPETYRFIRNGSCIFTSHAIEQIPDARVVVDHLKRVRERIVCCIQLEPLYREERKNLLGLLRNKYTRINDYNTNLLQVLSSDPLIEILFLETDIFGRNPLNPSSAIVWSFRS